MAAVSIQERIGKNGKKTYAVRYKDPVTLKSRHDKSFKRKKDAVDWKNQLIRSNDGIGMIKFFRTKNRKERTQRLMPESRKALINWREHLAHARHRRQIKVVADDYVFCRLDGTPIKGFKSAWKRACQLAGLEDFHYHGLRHTFCSNVYMSGGDVKEIMEMIGHEDINMTHRYTHLHMLRIQQRQQVLAEHYRAS